MPGYPLRLSDEVYARLWEKAKTLNMSMGKYLNKICKEDALGPNLEVKEPWMCFFCRKKATHFLFSSNGERINVCPVDFAKYKKRVASWKKKVETKE